MRFKGFDGEWTEIKEEPFIKNGNIISTSSTKVGMYTYFDRSREIKLIDTWKNNGEYLIFPSECNFYVNYFNGKFSHHSKTYRMRIENHSMKFIYYLITFKSKNIEKISYGSSVKRFSKNTIINCFEIVPSLPEQQKIAQFFSLLDHHIKLWERKLELCQLKKKYYLDKMFANKDFPKLRFKGFEGINLKYCFDELFETINLGFYVTDKNNFKTVRNEKSVKIYSQSLDEIMFYETESYFQPKNDIYILFGDHTRKIDLIKDSGVFYGDGLKILKLIKFSESFYLYYLLTSIKIKNLGYSRHFKLLRENNFRICDSIFEQQKIASFFEQKDKYINLCRLNIEKLKDRKKYYLNNMFI